jgi:DNA-nicking Smr family endonuclease
VEKFDARLSMNEKDRKLFLKALDNLPKDILSAKYDSAPVEDKPAARPRRVYNMTVDLHGFTKEQAITRLKNILTHSKGKHLRILVITGRGNNSENGIGILRKAVEDYLNKAGASYVRVYNKAAPEFGGEGAFDIKTK